MKEKESLYISNVNNYTKIKRKEIEVGNSGTNYSLFSELRIVKLTDI
jgi:hypothetical protein